MTTATRQLLKDVRYDRTTHDYAMYLDGEIVGYAATKDEAETELSKLVVNILEHERPAPSEERTTMTITSSRIVPQEIDHDLEFQAQCEDYIKARDAEWSAELAADGWMNYDPDFDEQAIVDANPELAYAANEVDIRIDPEVSDYADERAYVCERCGVTKPEAAFPPQDEDAVVCTACVRALRDIRLANILAGERACVVCGECRTTQWQGDTSYCSVHLDELLALDTSDESHTYTVTGTIQRGDEQIKTNTRIEAHSKLEAARIALAQVALPWRANWADVYVVQR